jgi:hypothetical protein
MERHTAWRAEASGSGFFRHLLQRSKPACSHRNNMSFTLRSMFFLKFSEKLLRILSQICIWRALNSFGFFRLSTGPDIVVVLLLFCILNLLLIFRRRPCFAMECLMFKHRCCSK